MCPPTDVNVEARGVTWTCTRLHVELPELGKVGAADLVGVCKDDLAQRQREEHVQEQDLVRPDDALLLRLQPQRRAAPPSPSTLILHQRMCTRTLQVCLAGGHAVSPAVSPFAFSALLSHMAGSATSAFCIHIGVQVRMSDLLATIPGSSCLDVTQRHVANINLSSTRSIRGTQPVGG